jgi:ABC-type lipoprotein release transport system permease subunit
MATPLPSVPRFPSLRLLAFLSLHSLAKSKVVAALMVLAVAVGAGFQIPNTANLHGYHHEILLHMTRKGMGDVRLRPLRGSFLQSPEALRKVVQGIPGVEAVEPVVQLPGAAARSDKLRGAMIVGTDRSAQRQPFALAEGRLWSDSQAGAEVVLGTNLARNLGVRLGDSIDLHILFFSDDPLSPIQSRAAVEARIVGLSAGVFAAADQVFVDRQFLLAQQGTEKQASALLVFGQLAAGERAVSMESTAALARAIREHLPQQSQQNPAAEVTTFWEDSPTIYSMLRSIVALSVVSHAMVVSAVMLPVIALLYVHVIRHRRDAALLAALGYTRLDLFLLFALLGFWVGLGGASLGAVFGLLSVRLFDVFPIYDHDGFAIRPLLTVRAVLEPLLLVFAAALCSSLLVAWRAVRLPPAPILKGEA